MNQSTVLQKLEEAKKLTNGIPEEYRREATSAVLAVLLIKENVEAQSPVQREAGVIAQPLGEARRLAQKIISVRQLQRITRRKGVTGDRVALALGAFIHGSEGRSFNTDDLRKHWAVLTSKTFATTWPLTAEAKGWLRPIVCGDGKKGAWEVTPEGHEEFKELQEVVSAEE